LNPVEHVAIGTNPQELAISGAETKQFRTSRNAANREVTLPITLSVEDALAFALAEAAKVGRFDVVSQLARELEAASVAALRCFGDGCDCSQGAALKMRARGFRKGAVMNAFEIPIWHLKDSPGERRSKYAAKPHDPACACTCRDRHSLIATRSSSCPAPRSFV
jgi:hypothetical protein